MNLSRNHVCVVALMPQKSVTVLLLGWDQSHPEFVGKVPVPIENSHKNLSSNTGGQVNFKEEKVITSLSVQIHIMRVGTVWTKEERRNKKNVNVKEEAANAM